MNAVVTPSHLTWSQRVLYGFTNWGLFVAGLINLAIGTWAAAHQSVTIAATSLTAGLVLLFAATIDRFESLKGLGVEAKTKQLDRKLEEADEALRRLKEVAELAGAALVDLNTKMGRWDSAPLPSETYALAQKVRSILTSLGSDSAAVTRILEPWARMMCRDMTAAVTRPLLQAMTSEITRLNDELARLPQPRSPSDPNFLRLTDAVRTAHKYRDERLSKFHELKLDEYPDLFDALFDDVPLADRSVVDSVRKKAMQYASGMRSLRETFTVQDPEAWSREIEASWKPK